MKRFWVFLLIAILLSGALPVSGFADGEHPITLEITCDPLPELEGDGTIPDLLFTIRNNSDKDYTLTNAKLTGGYEDREMILTESILVLAGATKEFHLTDVPVAADQLDRTVTYKLTWEETETIIDPDTGEATFLTHELEATASMKLERFVVPELSVSVSCEKEQVRADEIFTVVYTIRNDTDFDMTGLRLYDPEQSLQSIALPDSDLSAKQSITVSVDYKMGPTDMTFEPRIDYIARRREMSAVADHKLTVGSVLTDLVLTTEMRPATSEGTTFAVTVKNNGNRPVTKICIYDEINTLLEPEFSLEPDEYRTVLYTVKPASSADRPRTVRFHATAVDALDSPIKLTDPNSYTVLPYVAPESVRLVLSVVLQSPYYDENGKLCASVQFDIRNNGDVKIYNAKLRELTLFGEVVSYSELRPGDTYFTQIYQLDGVTELNFRVDATDPAGEICSSETIRLDLSGLKELSDKKNDSVIVYTTNPYMQDLDTKFSGVLRIVLIIGLSVAAVCAIVCIVLFIAETSIKNKLPAEFEEDMERVMRSTKRRTEKQLFSDAPTEHYGDLTEEEVKQRRELYAKDLQENLRREREAAGKPNPQRPAMPPVQKRVESDGTRVVPVRRTQPIPVQKTEPKPAPQKAATQPIPVAARTPEPSKEDKGDTKITVLPRRTFSTFVIPEPLVIPEPVVVPPPVTIPEPEPVPEPEIAPEPEPVPEPEIAPEPEPVFAPEPLPEPEIAPEPEPVFAPEPMPEPEPVPEPEPIPAQENLNQNASATGPRRIAEKQLPARRPIVPLAIKRMEG